MLVCPMKIPIKILSLNELLKSEHRRNIQVNAKLKQITQKLLFVIDFTNSKTKNKEIIIKNAE